MRYQGRLTNWKDDQGFGFITPNDGSAPVFVHIKALRRQSSRPVEGDLLTYELAFDERRRPRARAVLKVGDAIRKAPSGSAGRGWKAPAFGLSFCLILAGATTAGRLPTLLPGLYAIASGITFFAYWWDKSAAMSQRWRTSESTLHLFGLACGWPGGLLAQRLLRHKSIKQEFQTVFWGTVILNCIFFGWLFSAGGKSWLDSLRTAAS
ncbi:MAG: cold shock and DUF1294 domain-containing protein [Moraxellaceae bacterium]|nr:cold shock and DUF1294 domain-containing protein [Moraxellaceae bacterium]